MPTVLRPFDFISGHVLPGGALPIFYGTPRRLTSTEPLPYRRGDYGNPNDPDGVYQIVDAVMLGEGYAVLNWSFSRQNGGPLTFTPARGDGGELYRGGGSVARIVATQDGGTPGVQYFCGGTQWTVFAAQAPSGSWTSQIARLNISSSPDPATCPQPLNSAYTRWRVETLPILFRINGVFQTILTDCVISEHYDNTDPSTAGHVEQALYGRYWGRLGWFAYSLDPTINLGARLPQLPWPAPAGFNLQDARLNTNILPAASSQSTFGWP